MRISATMSGAWPIGGLLAGMLLLGASACGQPGEVEIPTLSLDCPGKCDGILEGKIRDLWTRYKELDLEDLMQEGIEQGLAEGVSWATDELNNRMSFDGLAAEIKEPRLFALDEDVAENDRLDNLDVLASDLAVRYGNRDLTTEVNRARQYHLRHSDDKVFTETSFEIKAKYSHGFNLVPLGLTDASGASIVPSVGFSASGSLKTRIIAAFEDPWWTGTGQAALEGVMAAREFLIPRSLADIREMDPGELVALRGQGTLAFNLAVGAPLFILEPTPFIRYDVAVRASLRAAVSGKLDIQLVRLEENTAVLDIGMKADSVLLARLALYDGWGVAGLVDTVRDIIPFDPEVGKLEIDIPARLGIDLPVEATARVDLIELLEDALQDRLEDQLEDKLDFSASISGERREFRASITRFRIHLDHLNDRAERALSQALRGDIRLAQALANEGHRGIVSEFDLSRSGVSGAFHAGASFLGMSFHYDTIEREGTTVVQTPAGVTTYLYKTSHKKGGYFFSKHERRLVPVSMLSYHHPSRTTTSEANLLVEVVEGNDYMRHDQWMDHVDGLLLAYGGWGALEVVARQGNEMQEYVEETCNEVEKRLRECVYNRNAHHKCKRPEQVETQLECKDWDEPEDCPANTRCMYGVCVVEGTELDPDRYTNAMGCRYAVLQDPVVINLGETARANLESFLDNLNLDASVQELLLRLARLRLSAGAAKEANDAVFDGPPASIVTSYRLDEVALARLMQAGNADRFQRKAQDYLVMDQIDRHEDPDEDDIEERRADNMARFADEFDDMRDVFERTAREYQKVLSLERSTLPKIGQLGPRALEVGFPVDAKLRPVYKDAIAKTPSTSRAFLVTDMFKEMERLGDKLSFLGQLGLPIGPRGEQLATYCLLSLAPLERTDLRFDLQFDKYHTRLTGDHRYYLEAGFEDIDRRAKGKQVKYIDGGLFNLWTLIYAD